MYGAAHVLTVTALRSATLCVRRDLAALLARVRAAHQRSRVYRRVAVQACVAPVAMRALHSDPQVCVARAFAVHTKSVCLSSQGVGHVNLCRFVATRASTAWQEAACDCSDRQAYVTCSSSLAKGVARAGVRERGGRSRGLEGKRVLRERISCRSRWLQASARCGCLRVGSTDVCRPLVRRQSAGSARATRSGVAVARSQGPAISARAGGPSCWEAQR